MNNFVKHYEINSSQVTVRGELGLSSLLGLLQDAASLHAELIGFGRESMRSSGLFWVLTRQRVKMLRWPRWKESIQIETWIRLGNKAVSNRDFRILCDGEEIGLCATSWVALDLSSRRPVAWDRSAIHSPLEDRGQVQLDPLRIAAEAGAEVLSQRMVSNGEIDHNLHVNNTRYAQWLLDALAFEVYKNMEIQEYAVNFLAETTVSEMIRIEALKKQNGLLHFQGIKVAQEAVAFTAQISFLA